MKAPASPMQPAERLMRKIVRSLNETLVHIKRFEQTGIEGKDIDIGNVEPKTFEIALTRPPKEEA